VSLAAGSVADAFVPSDDELRIRETVATIANRYGPEYMRRCSTEPDAGTNTHNLATKATRVDGGFRLRVTKVFISGVEMAHALFVVARTGERDAATGYGRLSLFVVADDRLVGAEGEGLRLVFDGLNPERIMTAVQCTGIGPARRRTWPSSPPPRRGSSASTAPSRPTAATESHSNMGLPTCGGG
jgi:alkylation response protein AidB-like acyl-CoA dehydrogenase